MVALLALVAGCDQEALYERFIPKEEAEFAKAHLALYQTRDFDAIVADLHPGMVDDELQGKIREVAEYFPEGEPTEILIVGSNTVTSPGSWSANLTFQYEFPEAYLVAAVSLLRQDDQLFVDGVNVRLMEQSLQEINEFRLGGRGLLGYIFLLAAAGVPAFIIISFIACLRTPIPRRKWLWAIFVLLGFGTLNLNWTTGELGYSMFSFQVLGAGFARAGLYGPLILSVAMPFGAVVFWMRRSEWLARADEGPA